MCFPIFGGPQGHWHSLERHKQGPLTDGARFGRRFQCIDGPQGHPATPVKHGEDPLPDGRGSARRG